MSSQKQCIKCKFSRNSQRFPLSCEHLYCQYCLLTKWKKKLLKKSSVLNCLNKNCEIPISKELILKFFLEEQLLSLSIINKTVKVDKKSPKKKQENLDCNEICDKSDQMKPKSINTNEIGIAMKDNAEISGVSVSDLKNTNKDRILGGKPIIVTEDNNFHLSQTTNTGITSSVEQCPKCKSRLTDLESDLILQCSNINCKTRICKECKDVIQEKEKECVCVASTKKMKRGKNGKKQEFDEKEIKHENKNNSCCKIVNELEGRTKIVMENEKFNENAEKPKMSKNSEKNNNNEEEENKVNGDIKEYKTEITEKNKNQYNKENNEEIKKNNVDKIHDSKEMVSQKKITKRCFLI